MYLEHMNTPQQVNYKNPKAACSRGWGRGVQHTSGLLEHHYKKCKSEEDGAVNSIFYGISSTWGRQFYSTLISLLPKWKMCFTKN